MEIKYSDIRKHLIKKDNQWDGEGLAFVTHYLQSQDNGSSKYFRKEAEEYLETLIHDLEFNYVLPFHFDIPFPPTENHDFRFIDLFAGIGGFRIAFQELNGKCVYSSEWNKYAKITYEANFGEVPFGDITRIDENKIPDHDILVGGFPCQPFSIAGVSKKNALGRHHGFLDKTQGTLFFDIARIIESKKPKAFLLENVKNLRSHDRGKTFRIIKETLKELEYHVFDEILDARHYVPQHRERIFIVGFSRKYFGEKVEFKFPEPPEGEKRFGDILESRPDPRYTLSDHLWGYLQEYARKHKAKGNGFGFGLTDVNGVARTLSARYYKDGSEILIKQGNGNNPRRLTPEECKRLMGFPEEFLIKDIGVSDTQLYKQFGNSVAVPVVRAVAASMMEIIRSHKKDNMEVLRKKRVKVLTQSQVKNVTASN
ncbi:MAG TPA: DNA (cytosine-5-)-methyltransferase [Bacteroidales bacterium]|nr:DNA (cytosine-5-)-methyltransferase [Bacteroidales bacterium]HSA42671.1 DNA (cytosine-5-)-methyltransferase [Bacteroidales bacterium]